MKPSTPSSSRLEAQKHALIEGLRSARAELLQAIAQIPAERLNRPFLGEWSAFELLAHLQGWDVTNQQAIQEILDGQYPGFFQHYDKDWRSYNARLVARYRLEDFAAQVAEVQRSHTELLDSLEALPAEALVNGKARRETGRSVSIRGLLKAEASDERQHAEQVRAIIQSKEGNHAPLSQ